MTTDKSQVRAERARRNVKDSVFTLLFSDPSELIKLYRALHPEDRTTTEADLADITCKSVLMNGQYNDLGFRVGDSLIILVEAQASWSMNILVRMFAYLAETYTTHFARQGQSLHQTAKVDLPYPELYVVYTGARKDRPRVISLREEFFGGRNAPIELRATMLYGDQTSEADRAKDIVAQYVEFTHIFDEQRILHGRTRQAIEETLRICAERNILVNFLESRRGEVMNVMDATFEQEMADRAIYAEGEAHMRTAIAKNLIAIGQMSFELIAKATGLSVDEVAQLARS